ncbi:hypothetical protein ABPG72_008282 [Tetrahymena utriculariae]
MEQQQVNLEYSPYIFEIESILEKRIHPKTGKTEYLVQWRQWPDDPTWEPAQNIQNFLKNNNLKNNNQKKKEEDQYSSLKQKKNSKIEEKMRKQTSNQVQRQNDSFQYLDEQIQFLQNKYELFISDSEIEQEKQFPNKKSLRQTEQIEDAIMIDNMQIEPIYKILDKQEVENTIYYLILYYDEELPQWVEQEKLVGYEDEIQEYEKQLIQEGTELNSSQLLETSIQSLQKENIQIVISESTPENIFNKVVSKENLEKSSNDLNQNQNSYNECNEGDFLRDQIQDIEASFKFIYSINWKPRKNGHIPQNKKIQFVQNITITPQEFIDQLLQNKFLN